MSLVVYTGSIVIQSDVASTWCSIPLARRSLPLITLWTRSGYAKFITIHRINCRFQSSSGCRGFQSAPGPRSGYTGCVRDMHGASIIISCQQRGVHRATVNLTITDHVSRCYSLSVWFCSTEAAWSHQTQTVCAIYNTIQYNSMQFSCLRQGRSQGYGLLVSHGTEKCHLCRL